MAEKTAPQGARGTLFAPAFYRPEMRFIDTVEGDGTGPAPKGADDTDPAEEVDWKKKYEETLAHSRKHEARAKENHAAAKANEEAARRLKELEDAQKTEAQKTAERIAQLEKENAGFKQENAGFKQKQQTAEWAREISKSTGVPADVLRGSTQEELEAHAEQLKPLFAGQGKGDPVPTIGQQPTNPTGNVSIADQIKAAEAAGKPELVAALKAMQLAG